MAFVEEIKELDSLDIHEIPAEAYQDLVDQNKVDENAIYLIKGDNDFDAELNGTSTNAPQTKVVYEALQNKANDFEVLSMEKGGTGATTLEGAQDALGITELKNSVSDGKTLVANAITAKGVSTATDATFATLAANIGNIKGLKYTSVTNKYHKRNFTVNLGMYPDVMIFKVERYDDNTLFYYRAWVQGVGYLDDNGGNYENYWSPNEDGTIDHVGAGSYVANMEKYYNTYFWVFKF